MPKTDTQKNRCENPTSAFLYGTQCIVCIGQGLDHENMFFPRRTLTNLGYSVVWQLNTVCKCRVSRLIIQQLPSGNPLISIPIHTSTMYWVCLMDFRWI